MEVKGNGKKVQRNTLKNKAIDEKKAKAEGVSLCNKGVPNIRGRGEGEYRNRSQCTQGTTP
jgi:hypothetical protein